METTFISTESTLKGHSDLHIHVSCSDLDGEDKESHRCEDPAVQRKRAKEAVRGATRESPNSLTDSRSFWCPHLL
ncbi:hypothetical protein CXB51_011269 [Gossypium anomalum]|uniref:Uncharacterized protein n=1 Tax=Gossypium anomalum TaxID=47600 RepID=A0A8J5Z479_9ROSI|nr:hypothetical protein CXB51_011269 [Gossypium anomalum]